MLVQGRRRQPVVGRGLGEGDRVADGGDGRRARADLDHRVQAHALGEGDPAVDGVDRAARDPRADDVLEPLHRGAGREPLHQEGTQHVAVGGAVLVAGEPRVLGQLGHPEHAAELAELAVVARGDDQVAVRAGERLVGEQAGVAVAHPQRDHPARDVGAALVDQPGQRGGQQVDLDVLAATGLVAAVDCGEHPDRGVQTGHHVEDRDAGPEGLPVRVAGQAHQPGDGLHDQVVAGQLATLLAAPEAADRGVDDAGVGRLDALVVQSEPGQAAGAEVLDHDVGPCCQGLRDRHVVGVLEVQGDGALVAVHPEEVRRDTLAHGR